MKTFFAFVFCFALFLVGVLWYQASHTAPSRWLAVVDIGTPTSPAVRITNPDGSSTIVKGMNKEAWMKAKFTQIVRSEIPGLESVWLNDLRQHKAAGTCPKDWSPEYRDSELQRLENIREGMAKEAAHWRAELGLPDRVLEETATQPGKDIGQAPPDKEPEVKAAPSYSEGEEPSQLPKAVIVVGSVHKGEALATVGKDFLRGEGKLWFQVGNGRCGLLTLFRNKGGESEILGEFPIEVPYEVVKETAISKHNLSPDGHLPVGDYELIFEEGENPRSAVHKFSIVAASSEKPGKVSQKEVVLTITGEKREELPSEIVAGTPVVFQANLPVGAKGSLHIAMTGKRGMPYFLKTVKVSGPGITKLTEADLKESDLEGGHLKPGEYELIFEDSASGVFSKDLTIKSKTGE